MSSRIAINLLMAAAVLYAHSSGVSAAGAQAQVDVSGGHDHPMVKRFYGSWLAGFKSNDWEQALFPTSMAVVKDKWVDALTVEGRVTKAVYVSPVEKSPLEVFRNYEQALIAAGFQKRFSCESQCSPLYFAMRSGDGYAKGMTWAKGYVVTPTDSRYNLDAGTVSSEDGRYWYGTLPRNGQEVHVMVYTAAASNATTHMAATYLQIVEPKAMPTGQVKVDAKGLDQGLKADGKIALYGLYFDTGKADIKPESSEQLSEMAKLFQAQPTVRVFIVGHTDNQGALDANMTLSQQRAQSVVNALSTNYRIDPKRMVGKGVGSLAPISTNGSEDGRAKNRRVELVLQ